MKNLKKLVVLGSLFGATYGAKAFEKNFEPVSENGNAQGIELVNGQLLVKSEGAKIGGIDTPYVFVGTNTTNFAQNGFAIKEMADANSVALDKNDVYFTRPSTNGVYKMSVSDKKALNGISGQLEFFESNEPVTVLSVQNGIIYTQNNDKKVIELGNVNAESDSSIEVPEELENTLHSVCDDGIFVVTDTNVIQYDKEGKKLASIPHGIVKNKGETLKDIVAIDKSNVFVLVEEGNLYTHSGTKITKVTSVSAISRSKDGKSLLITSTNSKNQTVIYSYDTKTIAPVYTEPSEKRKAFQPSVKAENGLTYYVNQKKIGYHN